MHSPLEAPLHTDAKLISAAGRLQVRAGHHGHALASQAREHLPDADGADARVFVESDEAARSQGLDVVPWDDGVGQGRDERGHSRAEAAALGTVSEEEGLPEVRIATGQSSAPTEAPCRSLHGRVRDVHVNEGREVVTGKEGFLVRLLLRWVLLAKDIEHRDPRQSNFLLEPQEQLKESIRQWSGDYEPDAEPAAAAAGAPASAHSLRSRWGPSWIIYQQRPALIVLNFQRCPLHHSHNEVLPIVVPSDITAEGLLFHLWAHALAFNLLHFSPAKSELWHNIQEGGDNFVVGSPFTRHMKPAMSTDSWIPQTLRRPSAGLPVTDEDWQRFLNDRTAPTVWAMNERSPIKNTAMSRLEVVKQLFETLTNRIEAYETPTCLGLVLFSGRDDIKYTCKSGETAVYDAVGRGHEELVKWKEEKPSLKDAQLRIIVLERVAIPVRAVLCGVVVTVLDVFREKHPPQQQPHEKAFLPCDDLPPLIDVNITDSTVERAARSLSGSAGLTGGDANFWQTFLLRYGAKSGRLCAAVASLVSILANTIVPWDNIKALRACRLIALDKCPGVRPIGVGEVLSRLTGKCMTMVTRSDLETTCGTDQLCIGDETKRLLLVDASNAFNRISRPAAIWNTHVLWPRCSRYAFNTYRGFAALHLQGSAGCLWSCEGVTQGDSMAIFVYACGSLPLIHALRAVCAEEGYEMLSSVGVGEEESLSASSAPLASSSSASLRQCWYADDSSALGKLHGILVWFRALRRIGLSYGYHPKAAKSFLVVKPELEQIAREVFEPEGVQIVTNKRFLGGYVGDKGGRAAFLCEKVEGWVRGVRALTSAARNFPHTAHAAMTRSLQMEWDYVFYVVLTNECALSPLREAIAKELLPALLGGPVTPSEVDLMLLPARHGGTGIRDPLDRATAAYPASRASTKVVFKSVQGKAPFHSGDHRATIRHALTQSKQQQDVAHKTKREAALSHIDRRRHRVLSRSAEYKTSGWLTTLPSTDNNTGLDAAEFRDALNMRYGRHPPGLAARCDHCNQPLTVDYALCCKWYGLVIHRHNELRDTFAELIGMAWGDAGVRREVVLKAGEEGEGGVRADIVARGVWERQAGASFDICITDPDAPSYASKN
ncbi:unnamed protein product [Vitrella brassicaformis CCMP3155]|uniref:Uncharacterized protein n=1 Tax=Vitrella brassicaformis (strain CCMP3155) TaxID=1169540 RepID=A0A0G4G092_VITBC|nr:unnamed protein product [Vitrella brassicaformis CCMP3155]|eukprot:CEM21107.1 unnamed protein product [Vitrella brassicaformis CCMP3155]